MHNMHHHNAFELYYIIKGEREYFIEDDFFKLSEGDLVIIPRNLLHRTEGKGASRFLIHFSLDYLKKYFTTEMIDCLSIHRPFIFHPEENLREQFLLIFNSLLLEYLRASKRGDPSNDPILAGYLYQILFIVTRANNVYVHQEYSDSRIGSIIKYINENYSQIADIEEISSHFYISKYHLCRIFTQNLGVPLITYLNTIKIRKACEMIKSEKGSLTEIAMKCGFNSSSYFCKVFKSEKGVTPATFRRQMNSK
jgi:AraC-like DNA-binding protein